MGVRSALSCDLLPVNAIQRLLPVSLCPRGPFLLGACQEELKTLREYLINVYHEILKHWYPNQSELQEAGLPGSKDCFFDSFW